MFRSNRLPQYIFGLEMNPDEQSDKNTLNYFEDLHLSEPNLSQIQVPSPSSSLASTKKLEWDSGADIGYINESVKRKSKSFPSLTMNLNPISLNDTLEVFETKSGDYPNVKSLACIVEDDLSKLRNKKKPKSFKHSTPYDNRRIYKSSGATNPNEKSTSPLNIFEIKDACFQTTLVNKSSKGIQTDNLVTMNPIENKSLQTDIIDLLGIQSITSSGSGGSSLKSGSFQYIPGSEFNCSPPSGTDIELAEMKHARSLSIGTLKSGSSAKSSSSSTSSQKEESDTGSCNILGQIISTQYSKNLIDDIDKSLAILQKFIQSKNYSNDTKKYYAKKIVTKIINNRYSGDTESNNNSSLSSTGTQATDTEIQIEFKTPYSEEMKTKVDYNLINNSSKDKKFVECGTQCDEMNKKSPDVNDKNDFKIKESLQKLNQLQSDLKNWREAQTLSEKLFEARKSKSRNTKSSNSGHSTSQSMNGKKKRDYLVQHSKNERKRQLFWINSEISYLQKLKDLLQFNSSNTSSTSTIKTTTPEEKSDSRLTIHKSVSNSENIEKKFNEEFGIKPPIDNKDSELYDIHNETLNKLSKYLTNDQIKFIIDHDANKIQCGKSECCKRTVLTIPENATDQNNTSYDSHRNSIYEEKSFHSARKSVSKQTKQTSSSDLNPQTVKTSAVDATTQCTLNIKSIDTKTQILQTNNNKFVQSFHKNVKPLCENQIIASTSIDNSHSVSSNHESIIIEKSKTGKENFTKKSIQRPNKLDNLLKSTAYFLTFDEESQSDIDMQEKRSLEHVVVKIPKYHRSNYKSKGSSRTENYSLEEYLLRNRPNFVRAANWRWTKVRHTIPENRPGNIFTCQEMKEMTMRKYKNLPEIKEKAKNSKTQIERRHNRFQANIFSKKLQKKTLQGHICIATCASVMASE